MPNDMNEMYHQDRPAKEPEDMVKSPKHYTSVMGTQLGIEVIDIANAYNLNGNRFSALKYLLRAGMKDVDKEVEDLEKIIQYVTFEIRRIKGEPVSDTRRADSSAYKLLSDKERRNLTHG